MVGGGRILSRSASDAALLGLCVYLAGFTVILASGLLTPTAEGVMRTLHSPAALIAVSALLITLSLRLIALIRERQADGLGRRFRLAAIGFHAGLLFMAAGIVLSSLTRFEGRIALIEGQSSGKDGIGYIESSQYSRRFAGPPDMDIMMVSVSPRFYDHGRSFWNVRAALQYRNRASANARIVNIDFLVPSVIDGALFRIADFGYVPRYRIAGRSGEVLDEAYVMLKLFPPGSEDSFNPPFSPHVVYLKYYPDGLLTGENGPANAGGTPRPVYKLRLVRNLDLLITDRSLAPDEKAPFDQESISFAEPRKWAEIRVVKDPGLYLLMPGTVIVLALFVWSRCAGVAIIRIENRQPDHEGPREEGTGRGNAAA